MEILAEADELELVTNDALELSSSGKNDDIILQRSEKEK